MKLGTAYHPYLSSANVEPAMSCWLPGLALWDILKMALFMAYMTLQIPFGNDNGGGEIVKMKALNSAFPGF